MEGKYLVAPDFASGRDRPNRPRSFRPLVLLLLVLALVCGAAAASLAAPIGDSLLVRFRAAAPSPQALLASPVTVRALARFSSVKSREALLPRAGIVRLRAGSSAAAQALLAALRRDPDVLYAEPNYTARALFSPNDPLYTTGNQWFLGKVSAPAAWDVTTGSRYVAVAILDSGVDPAHPDLEAKLLPGYNVFDKSANIHDGLGHGTHVAGIAAAVTNNGVGVAGAGFQTRIVPVKVLDDNGSGDYAGIVEGIRWATECGVKVINLSLAGYDYSQALQDAVNYAWERGVVIVAAAGNDGNSPNPTAPQYPAAMNNVVSVAATDTDDSRARFSTYGSTVDVAAPGVSITSTAPTHSYSMGGRLNYEFYNGTSMATPVVAAEAALLFARSGLGTPPATVVNAITSTMDAVTDPTLPKIPGTNTPGRVNFVRALASLAPGNFPAAPLAPANLTAVPVEQGVRLSWSFVASATSYNVKRSRTPGGPYTVIAADVTTTGYTDTGVTGGTTYYYVVTAVNAAGESGPSNQASATGASVAPTTLRINCGGGAFTSADGRTFAADSQFIGGAAYVYAPRDVLDTPDDALYTDVRYGGADGFSYKLPVADGNYTLKLHFAECYVDAPNQRVFDVLVNGTPVLTNFDILAQAGRDRVLIKSFPVSASGGTVTVTLVARVAVSIINALEIVPADASSASPPAPANLAATARLGAVALSWTASTGAARYTVKRSQTPGGPYTAIATDVAATSYTDAAVTNGTTYYYVVTAVNAAGESAPSNEASATPQTALRLNVGGGEYVSRADGRVFAADAYFSGNTDFGNFSSLDVQGTTDDALYLAVRWSPTSFTYTLPAADGPYTLRLHFVECSHDAAGKRLFHVSVNGTRVLTNFDIFAQAGKNRALARELAVTAVGGQVRVTFEAVVGNALLSAIELIRTN